MSTKLLFGITDLTNHHVETYTKGTPMADDSREPNEPSNATLGPPTTTPRREVPRAGAVLVRVLFGIETVCWALVVCFGGFMRSWTLEQNFELRQRALNGELVFICFSSLMMLLAIAGLIRARGMLFRAPVATSVAIGMRLFLVPLTAVLLIIAAAGFVA